MTQQRKSNTELPKYKEVKECPKCGHKPLMVKGEWTWVKFCDSMNCFVTGEHLHRDCCKCGYKFLEQTKDA